MSIAFGDGARYETPMTEFQASELLRLRTSIERFRSRGEALQRIFWQISAVFGSVGFLWVFIYPMTHAGAEKLPFQVIIGFALFAIAFLVTIDAVFFNKAFHMESELETHQTTLAAQILGLDPKHVTLRYAATKKLYVLGVTKFIGFENSADFYLETQSVTLNFYITTESIDRALALIAQNQVTITSKV
jgi:hypothetical protein